MECVKVDPLPDCPCREIILLSRQMLPGVHVDEANLYAWACPIHNPQKKVQ